MPTGAWAVFFAVALLLPGLGASGFWDPWELQLAERVRDVARGPSLLDPTVGGRYGAEPPLDLFLAALGVKLLHASELGARLFGALAALGALLAVYWAGVGLFTKRAALLATLALGTMPLFFLQGRQLVSDAPLIAGLALAFGGLGRFAWPPGETRSWRDLALGVLGLVLGTLSGGALIGLALPCLALAGALLVCVGQAPRARALLIAFAAVGITVLAVTLLKANVAGKFSLWLGGTPRGGTPDKMFEYLVRQIGFGIFPWSALAVFALGRALVSVGAPEDEPGATPRRGFAQVYCLVAAAFGFALSSVFVLMTGDGRFAYLAPIALAIGAFLDEALEADAAEPVLGLLVATGTAVVARDLFLAPEELVSQHLLAKVKWPPSMSIGPALLATGVLLGLSLYAGLAARGRALGKVPPRPEASTHPLLVRAEALAIKAGRWGIHVAVGTAVVFAFGVIYGLVPALSKHLSFKPVFESFAKFAREGEPIGRFHVEGHGASFYSDRDMTELPSQERVVEFLRPGKRAFALVSAEDLAGLDTAFHLANVPYSVVDSSSSRFLLLSNQLEGGQEDQNPLKRDVWMAPQPPTAETIPGATETVWHWPDAKPPWTWTIPTKVVFGDAIELVGVTFPPTVRRPAKFTLELYFRVNRRPAGGYKIFAHFDAPGQPRVIGDHQPLDGAFPTSYWLPGEYIRDKVEVDVPLMTTPAGVYTLYLGFWPGGEAKRLKITSGPSDGVDRTRVGTIEIR